MGKQRLARSVSLLLAFAYLNYVVTSTSGLCHLKTTDGNCCSIPFVYKGVTYDSCTKADHDQLWCSLDSEYMGNWGNCALSVPSGFCPPRTTDGKCCRIPFVYKGVTYNSCTKAEHGQLWCSLDSEYKGNWGNCALSAPQGCCHQKTTDGKCCSIPFVYKGVTYNSCTKADHNQLWCSLDSVYKGNWGDCALGLCHPKTTDGKCCSIPFVYKGVTYNSCTKADHNQLWCSLDSEYKGNWGNCDFSVPSGFCPPKVADGKCCSIPFVYKGRTYNSCTKADHNQLWCSLDPVYKGNWDNCAISAPSGCCRLKTTDGKCCSIPFVYKGVTYNSCTKAEHNQLWCSLDSEYKGNWGNCALSVPPGLCHLKTTGGKCCSIPFDYKGVTYNSCTKADHNQLWCSLDSVYKGNWGNCA